jgi:MFS superfamily sulfate permease-like transporter
MPRGLPARLGFIANLISRPVLVGYLAGVSLVLLVSQLPSVTHGLHSLGLIRPLIELIGAIGVHGQP